MGFIVPIKNRPLFFKKCGRFFYLLILTRYTNSKKLTTSYRWYFYATAVGVGLKAEFNSLPCANSAVPADVGGGVRIAAAQVGIP